MIRTYILEGGPLHGQTVDLDISPEEGVKYYEIEMISCIQFRSINIDHPLRTKPCKARYNFAERTDEHGITVHYLQFDVQSAPSYYLTDKYKASKKPIPFTSDQEIPNEPEQFSTL